MQEIIAQLEKFIAEASRPGLLGLPGKKVESRTGKDLSAYFKRLSKSLPVERLAQLVSTASTKTSGHFAAEHVASIYVRRMQPQLLALLKAGYLEGVHASRKHGQVMESVEDEPRDDHGRWTGMDSNSSSYLNGYEHGGEIGTKTTGNKAKHLLRIKGQVVGHMVVEYKDKDAVVKDVDLDEKYQGKGYGKAMYRHAINRAQAKGMTTFRSETSKENPAGNSEQAKNVWSSLGGNAVNDKYGNLDHHSLSIKESVEDEARDDHGRWTSDDVSFQHDSHKAGDITTHTTELLIKGEKVGHLRSVAGPSGKVSTISDTDIDKEFRNKGLGRQMYNQHYSHLKSQGVEKVISPGGLRNVNSDRMYKGVAKGKDSIKDLTKEAQPFDRSESNLLSDAVEWAEKQAGELVRDLDQTTIQAIADEVASGIENQLGVDGTAKEIRDLLSDWTTSRAFTIATTEINRAMSWATNDSFDGGYKRWILAPEACPICEANADQGAIPVDDDFDSGDAFPPAHPNCRCAIAAAPSPDDE